MNDKYEVPKDFVNRKPLNSYMTPKSQRAQKFGAKYAQNAGVHIATLVSIPQWKSEELKYQKKSEEVLNTFSIPTWIEDYKNIKEIEIPQWLLGGRAN